MFLPGAFVRADAALLQINTELKSKIAKQEEVAGTAGRILNDLYRYREQKFREAIVELENLLKSPVNMKNPALWVYLAAAHGQAYRWEKEEVAGDSEAKQKQLDYHRACALAAVKKALELGDSWKPSLQMLWDPQHPNKQSSGNIKQDENDLEVFYNDPAFKELLGK
jgi:hypothetical protein